VKDGTVALKTLDRIIQTNLRDIEALYRKGLLIIESMENLQQAIALGELPEA
jgi:hypothetical protein